MLFSHEVWEDVGEDLIEAQGERPLLDTAERILSICSLDAEASVFWMPACVLCVPNPLEPHFSFSRSLILTVQIIKYLLFGAKD
jgi:hypothetical protein